MNEILHCRQCDLTTGAEKKNFLRQVVLKKPKAVLHCSPHPHSVEFLLELSGLTLNRSLSYSRGKAREFSRSIGSCI